MTKKESVDFIIKTLDELYPDPPIPLVHKDPYTLLISVLLSAQSTDARVNIITPILFKKADNPYDMVKLSVDEIREIIKNIASQGTTILLASHLLDEVEKVCSHVVVIREGIKLYSGSVDEMTASHGLFELKVETDFKKLIELLSNYDGIANTKMADDKIIATLNKPITATEINNYLFKNDVVLSHLVKRKPSLEQQFLSLTNNKS
jgi:ABC-type uncharacterized transport system ATPase subunit